MDELSLLRALADVARSLGADGDRSGGMHETLAEPLAGVGAEAAFDEAGGVSLRWLDGRVDETRVAFEVALNHVAALSRQAALAQGPGTLDPAGFLSELERCASAARWRDGRLSLCVFDVAGLTLGPGVDETRLVELVGTAARGSVRQGDVVGHLGAGRFALLFPRAGTFEARAAHRRVRDAIGRLALDGDDLACGPAGFSELSEDGTGDLLADAVARLHAARVKHAYTGPIGPGTPAPPLAG
jgi:hypothetical protein